MNPGGNGNTLTGRHTRPPSSSGHPAIWDVFDGSAGSTGSGSSTSVGFGEAGANAAAGAAGAAGAVGVSPQEQALHSVQPPRRAGVL